MRDAGAGLFLFRRFLLVKVLGRGASGVVWLAKDSDLELDVALKLIGETSVRDEAAAEQLREETRLCLRLSHPHIVRIFSFHQEGPKAAISMEYVKGQTLHSWRTSHPDRRLSLAELEGPVRQMIAAMQYAHDRAGVLHLDLKPANLMIDDAGDLRVLDFGIGRARLATSAERSLGTGSRGYMSPQRCRSEPAIAADDIFSTGALLYEMLTGTLPDAPCESGTESMDYRRPVRINERIRASGIENLVLPRNWEDVIAACLEEKPENRPASFGELAAALELRGAEVDPSSLPVAPRREPASFISDPSPIFAVTRKVPPLLERWASRAPGRPCWEDSLDYADAAYRLLAAGEPLTAFEVVQDGIHWYPSDSGLERLLGITLIRLSRSGEARRFLEPRRPTKVDPAFSAVIGKAMLHEAISLPPEQGASLAEKALSELEPAAGETTDFLVPMEAMVAAILVGAKSRARAFAQAVSLLLDQQWAGLFGGEPGRRLSSWQSFALGLSVLAGGDLEGGRGLFAEAAEGWRSSLYDLAEGRRLLAAVVAHIAAPLDYLNQVLPMPAVAVAVGHMFDRPDRAIPRFPRSEEEVVRAMLGRFLIRENVACGYASGACGTDILFHEELHQQGLPSVMVLPLPLSEPGQLGGIVHSDDDAARLLQVADECAAVVATSRFDSGDDEVESAYCLACLLGLAGLHAATLDAPLRPVAVWDGRAGDRRGGTADMVAYWRSLGLPVEIIPMGAKGAPEIGPGLDRLPDKIRSILVIRAPGYAGWADRTLEEYEARVLPEIRSILASSATADTFAHGPGDEIVSTFPSSLDAATVAAAIAHRLDELGGLEYPDCARLRYVLHAGPLIRRESGTFLGSHVNLARSVSTTTSHLFCTEPFAALLHFSGPGRFQLQYTGQAWLANGFGPRPLYQLCPIQKTH